MGTFLFLIVAFLEIILFLIVLGLVNPAGFIRLFKVLRRYRFREHAKRYGLQAAYEDLKGETWVLNPWEQTLLRDLPPPTAAQYYAYNWTTYLKVALGLAPSKTKVTLTQRWQAFKDALLGLGIELGVLEIK